MNWGRWLAGIAFAALAIALPSCGGGSGGGGSGSGTVQNEQPAQNQSNSDEVKALRDSLAAYLKKDTNSDKNLNAWLVELAEAVCQLEKKATQKGWALDSGKRYCQGAGGPPDKKPPPAFPPQ